MSDAGVAAARELAAVTTDLITTFDPEDWAADAACRGWRVQDLICHMGFFFNFIADPTLDLPDNPSGRSERLNDAAVIERADWEPAEVVEYYRVQSAAGLGALEALPAPEMSSATVDLLDLGTYHLAQLADALAFDHLVHLTADLLAPFGPVSTDLAIAVGAAIDPAIDWMMAGLPAMCGDVLTAALDAPVGLHLTGVTDRSFRIERIEDGVVVTETPDLPDHVANSDALDFTRWATRRTAWRSAVDITGDRARVAGVLDRIDIV
ncbi:maleylpyruvate isomerase N-terminal domain-containing protein [Gordonia sp. L191]|uniref:maleylpyruvate isomerase N-terminal domain-containing protein n=1 Tax=Gordonia sp. L191 TaxID=2982699 RepID=UPI0024C0B2F6|nr:maleylpyruvate isomerase N-terminal domain-containing protein [Gordonia sp. L191]WHU47631.1 maleylpyruvate isomerase N-terminal domain-containing protein [Gordonia sp. L191]